MHAGLLKAITESPYDDDLRGVLADWLADEGGEPEWAQFIRDQCEVERHRARHGCQNCPAVEALLRMCRQLFYGFHRGPAACLNGYSWSRAVVAALRTHEHYKQQTTFALGSKNGSLIWSFNRGLVDTLGCPLWMWIRHGAEVVQSAPVTFFRPTNKRPWWQAGIRDRAVWFCGGLGEHDVDAELWPYLTGHKGEQQEEGMLYAECIYYGEDCRAASALASDDLAWACIEWARDRAGLPPL